MKKIQLFIFISLIFFVSSCTKQDLNPAFYDLGSEFLISSPGYTSLDNQVVFNIDNLSKNLNQVTIKNLGGTLADGSSFTSTYSSTIPIDNSGAGSITVSDTDLGLDGIGASANFEFDATYNGKPFSRYYTVTETNPISIDVPSVKHAPSSDTTYLHFDIAPVSATVTGVKVQTKVGANGSYVDLSGNFNAKDSVAIVGGDYNLGDTLYVNVIGIAGTKTANTVTSIVVEPYSFTKKGSFTDSTNVAYDLVGDSLTAFPPAGADIQCAISSFIGGYNVGFTSPDNTLFVKGTSSDYADADILTIKATDFSSAVNSVSKVAVDDVYIYKTMRGATAHYGVMKIKAVNQPQNASKNAYIVIEYKY